MKKKLDAMTVISIVLIVINLLLLLPAIFGDSCGDAFDVFSQTSLLNFGQLFGGTVYAAGLPQFTKINVLSGIIRLYVRSIENDILFMVFYSDSISNNKTFLVRC